MLRLIGVWFVGVLAASRGEDWLGVFGGEKGMMELTVRSLRARSAVAGVRAEASREAGRRASWRCVAMEAAVMSA